MRPRSFAAHHCPFLIAIVALLVAIPGTAQIAFDFTASTAASGTSLTWTHIVGTQSNRILDRDKKRAMMSSVC